MKGRGEWLFCFWLRMVFSALFYHRIRRRQLAHEIHSALNLSPSPGETHDRRRQAGCPPRAPIRRGHGCGGLHTHRVPTLPTGSRIKVVSLGKKSRLLAATAPSLRLFAPPAPDLPACSFRLRREISQQTSMETPQLWSAAEAAEGNWDNRRDELLECLSPD